MPFAKTSVFVRCLLCCFYNNMHTSHYRLVNVRLKPPFSVLQNLLAWKIFSLKNLLSHAQVFFYSQLLFSLIKTLCSHEQKEFQTHSIFSTCFYFSVRTFQPIFTKPRLYRQRSSHPLRRPFPFWK